MNKIIIKIKQVLCNHDYDYWSSEKLCINPNSGNVNRIFVPTHTLNCNKCGHMILIRDMAKQSTRTYQE